MSIRSTITEKVEPSSTDGRINFSSLGRKEYERAYTNLPCSRVGNYFAITDGVYCTYHNSLTCRLNNRDMAVTVKPKEQKASRTLLPKASRITPASTDAMRIIPCEPMLVKLFTLLSLSLSTIRIIAVVTGIRRSSKKG